MKDKILKKIDKKDYSKMNLISLNLTQPYTYSSHTIYNKSSIQSSFHNSQDLKGGIFYKKTSKLLR